MADKRKKFKKKSMGNENFIVSVLCGFLTGIACIFIISLICSSLSLKFKNPINATSWLAIICLTIGSLIGGISSGMLYKSNPILSSAVGSIIIGIILLLTNITNDGSLSIINLLLSPVISVVGGIIGGMICKSFGHKSKVKRYLS